MKRKLMCYFKSMTTKKFIKYHVKWQLSVIITIPLMYLFLDHFKFPYWLTNILFNLVGAFIFWPIDNFLVFNNKNKEKKIG